MTVALPEPIETNIYFITGSDTLKIKPAGREFVIQGHIDAPQKATLKTDNKNCSSSFYIDTSAMKLSTRVSRNPDGICVFKAAIDGSSPEELHQLVLDQLGELRQKYRDPESWKSHAQKLITRIISDHRDLSLSSDLVLENARFFDKSWTRENYALLSERLKNSKQGFEILKTLTQYELLKKGNYFPDFTQQDIQGVPFNLSSLKGKVVLIEFWASWCGPCRRENPTVRKTYEAWHEKGFEIVGVSLDFEAEKWKAAVEKDQLPWIHVSQLNGWDNELARDCKVNYVPFNILLDSEGKIVATDLRGGALDKAIKKLL